MAPGALLACFVRPALRALRFGPLLAVLGCGGEILDLGSSPLASGGAAGTAGTASRVWDVNPTPLLPQMEKLLLANPTLKYDASELYYSAQVRGSDSKVHIKVATPSASGFGNPMPVVLGGDSQPPDVSSPAVSAEADELWFGQLSATSGYTEIWHSAREGAAWAVPTLVPELSSPFGDTAARPPALQGTIMPLSSKRHGGKHHQIYFSERAGAGSPWGEPLQPGLAEVNSTEFQSADGFLNSDGLELYFSSTRDGDHTDHDLYVARRGAIGEAFGAPQPLVDLNDPVAGMPSEERMPWLSPNGTELYFVSDRSGQYTLYIATKL
jgi:WD40-like Beta Propeller Repeat